MVEAAGGIVGRVPGGAKTKGLLLSGLFLNVNMYGNSDADFIRRRWRWRWRVQSRPYILCAFSTVVMARIETTFSSSDIR